MQNAESTAFVPSLLADMEITIIASQAAFLSK